MEVSTCILKLRVARVGVKYKWHRCDISLKSKVCVWCAAVHSVLSYGWKTLSLHAKDVGRLNVSDHRFLSSMPTTGYNDRVSNVEFRHLVLDAGSKNYWVTCCA